MAMGTRGELGGVDLGKASAGVPVEIGPTNIEYRSVTKGLLRLRQYTLSYPPGLRMTGTGLMDTGRLSSIFVRSKWTDAPNKYSNHWNSPTPLPHVYSGPAIRSIRAPVSILDVCHLRNRECIGMCTWISRGADGCVSWDPRCGKAGVRSAPVPCSHAYI